MLCGTFKWTFSDKPASLDIVFNQTNVTASSPTENTTCTCSVGSIYFTVLSGMTCPVCNGISPFVPTASRISSATSSSILPDSYIDTSMLLMENNNNKSTNTKKKYNKGQSYSVENSSRVLRDITNTLRPPLCVDARPDNVELSTITRMNHMLSNFVVSYFFKILPCNFPSILYQEFLFDFVKREGGWKQFVQYSRSEGHSTDFLDNLKATTSICIVPICCDIHWTVLIRKFVENVWEIYYIDSISQGSDERMRQWQNLFQDDDLFSGNWIKLKIIPQTELECGARVCLHGLCFALSLLDKKDIGRQLERIKGLAVRSRLLVSPICTDGQWSNPGWLKRIIGTPTSINQAGATAITN